jgi:predicted deacylase
MAMPQTGVNYATAELTSGESVRIPYWQISSDSDGPKFLVLSCQHGNEVNGSEAIRRFVQIAQQELKCGIIFAVPFANILAMRKRRPHISLGPEQPYSDDQGHNMNRTWPGKVDGNDTERLAYAINEAVAKQATHVLDFHSWARFSATGAIVRKAYPPSRELADVSAIRFIHVSATPTREPQYTTIGGLFSRTGRAGFTIELTGQYVIAELEVQRGVRAATNVAKPLGMLDGELEGLDEPSFYLDEVDMTTVKAPGSGLFVEGGFATWDYVERGQFLGHLLNDETLATIEIVAPVSGYLRVYGAGRANCDVALPAQHPYASAGELLATIVSPNK